MNVFIRLRFSVEQLVAEMADMPVILLKTWSTSWRSFYFQQHQLQLPMNMTKAYNLWQICTEWFCTLKKFKSAWDATKNNKDEWLDH